VKDLALGLGREYGERHCEMLRFAQHDKFLYQTDKRKQHNNTILCVIELLSSHRKYSNSL